MTYCLMTEDKKIRVEIRCTLANKPETLPELFEGLRDQKIQMIDPDLEVFLGTQYGLIDDSMKLVTDWERTGPQARYINWIAVENL